MIRCSEGCPSGMTCAGGLCTSGAACGPDSGLIPDASPACGVPGLVTDVALGLMHACSLENDGTIWCSGVNDHGELGNGAFTPMTATPTEVVDALGPITDALSISAGKYHTCAVRARDGGSVWCWGQNPAGQLGNASQLDSSIAVEVLATAGGVLTGAAEVTLGDRYSCARTTAGQAWCWGEGARYQLGDGTTFARATASPVLSSTLEPLAGIVQLASGRSEVCALDGAGTVWCWGHNNRGQLGDGSTVDRVLAHYAHACARTTSGRMLCWGRNTEGELGDGTYANLGAPAPLGITCK